jgi:hypothetical protein
MPLNICILGDDPFGADIDKLVPGQVAGVRSVVISRIQRPPAPRTCQVVFVSRSERNIASVLSKLGNGVLTVSDRDQFLLEGGMIAMFVEGDHVRFDINQRASLASSLKINSRLLTVARKVEK